MTRPLSCLETSGKKYPWRHNHISEELITHPHRCEKLETHTDECQSAQEGAEQLGKLVASLRFVTGPHKTDYKIKSSVAYPVSEVASYEVCDKLCATITGHNRWSIIQAKNIVSPYR